MQTSKPGRESDQFALRLPDGMRDRIKAAADAAGRSMNAEIVATLMKAYPQPIHFSDEFVSALSRALVHIGVELPVGQSVDTLVRGIGIEMTFGNDPVGDADRLRSEAIARQGAKDD